MKPAVTADTDAAESALIEIFPRKSMPSFGENTHVSTAATNAIGKPTSIPEPSLYTAKPKP